MVHKHFISLLFNLDCNLDCYYCDYIRHENKPINKEKVFEILDYLDSKVIFGEYDITGGEPGLLPTDFINSIIDRYPVTFHTNGVALSKPINLDKARKVFLHVFNVEDLKTSIDLDNLEYVFVVTKDNIELVKPMFETAHSLNKKLVIRYALPKTPEAKILDAKDKESISKYVNKCSVENPGEECFNDKKLFCSVYQGYPQLDFVNNQIIQCCLGYSSSNKFPLTTENLDAFIDETLFIKAPNNKACLGCSIPTNTKHTISNIKLLKLLKAKNNTL